MTRQRQLKSREAALATDVVLLVLRLNGQLLTAGDQLSAPHDLSSARWQVLGALALEEQPLTVPQIARRMGLARQSVHATVKRLVDDGLLERMPNLDHRRSQLAALTELGSARFAAVSERQAQWVDRLSQGLGERRLATTAAVLRELCDRLERDAAPNDEESSHADR